MTARNDATTTFDCDNARLSIISTVADDAIVLPNDLLRDFAFVA